VKFWTLEFICVLVFQICCLIFQRRGIKNKKNMLRRISGFIIVIIFSVTCLFAQDNQKVILFFGNSLTAGMGLDQNQAFPALIREKIDETDKPYLVVNAGLSGETSAGGLSRIDWILNQQVDVFVLELGANDGLRGLPLESTKDNLQGIIDKVKAKYPQVKIIVAGMMVPPNMGEDYSDEFVKIYPELADKNGGKLISFLLEGVAGNTHLNLPDGIHPNVEGHRIVANNVWKVLKPML
jgi:acyl-CoA thioesterase-1